MRAELLALALLAGLLTAGCITPRALGQLRGFQPEALINAQPVREGVEAARLAAWAMAVTLIVIQCLLTAWHVYFGGDAGGEAGRWASGFIVWALGGLVAISSLGAGQWYSVDRALRELGTALGEYMKPGEDPLRRWVEQVVLTAEVSRRLQMVLGTGGGEAPDSAALAQAIAVAEWHSAPFGATLHWLNGAGVFVMKMILQTSLAWLLAFYTMLGPVVAVTLLLPGTRGIFWGYCRMYLSLCLWPALFGVAERVAQAVPWAGAFAGVQAASGSRDALELANALSQATAMMFIANVMFFFVYLGVPIAAVKLVNAAGAPFRSR